MWNKLSYKTGGTWAIQAAIRTEEGMCVDATFIRQKFERRKPDNESCFDEGTEIDKAIEESNRGTSCVWPENGNIMNSSLTTKA